MSYSYICRRHRNSIVMWDYALGNNCPQCKQQNQGRTDEMQSLRCDAREDGMRCARPVNHEEHHNFVREYEPRVVYRCVHCDEERSAYGDNHVCNANPAHVIYHAQDERCSMCNEPLTPNGECRTNLCPNRKHAIAIDERCPECAYPLDKETGQCSYCAAPQNYNHRVDSFSERHIQEVKNASELIKFIALLATFAERFEKGEITYASGGINIKEHTNGEIEIRSDLRMRSIR